LARRKINQGEIARKVFEAPSATGTKNWRLDQIRYCEDGSHLIRFGVIYFPEVCEVESAPFHSEMVALQNGFDRVAIAAPRKHAKSVWTSYIGVIYDIVTLGTTLVPEEHKCDFVLFLQANQELATDALTDIRSELMDNELLRSDFGDLIGNGRWTMLQIDCANGMKVVCRGMNVAIRGIRQGGRVPKKIILDDVDTDATAYSRTESEKLIKRFRKGVANVGGFKPHKIFAVGTVITEYTLIADLLRNPSYVTRNYPAILSGDIDDPNSVIVPLWPAAWTPEKLRAKKKEIGSVAFNSEFMNLPYDPEMQAFRENAVKACLYDDSELPVDKKLECRGAADLAISQSRKADQFVQIATRRDRAGILWVVDAERGRFDFPTQGTKVLGFCARNGIKKFGTEDVAYQRALKQALEIESRKSRLYTRFVGIKQDRAKEVRILGLVPLIENGTLRIPKRLNWLWEALLMWPNAEHDDEADGLEMAVRMWERPVKEHYFTGIRPIGGNVMAGQLKDRRILKTGKAA
jgi:predicted phage terminase large subunit-like protein